MASEVTLNNLVINYLTQSQFNSALSQGTIDANQIYLTPDDTTIPTQAAAATTGITATTTETKTTVTTGSSIYGVKSGTNSTTTASKASGGNGSASNWVFEDVACDDITAWSAGSGSYSHSGFSGGSGSFTQGAFTGGSLVVTSHVLSFTPATHGADSHTHTAAVYGTDSHTHTAPSLSYSAKTASHVKSGGNGSAPTWSFTDVTVPIRADSSTSIPSVSTTSASVTISDPGHIHTLS